MGGGFQIKISLVKNAIESMVNLEDPGDPVSSLELEPRH